jgi:hypothetical protein
MNGKSTSLQALPQNLFDGWQTDVQVLGVFFKEEFFVIATAKLVNFLKTW